jgi:hypothetical protein
MAENGFGPVEFWAELLSLPLAVFLWGKWYWQSFRVRTSGLGRAGRTVLQLTPLVCGVVLYLVLRRFAAQDVRLNSSYQTLYMLLGAAWLGVVERAAFRLGLSARDDVLERHNPAAAVALSGLMLGSNFAFAGANIGNGPGAWVVVFCGLLATSGLFASWWALDALTGLADAITVDRDFASGLRAAGFFIGSGLILGRAVAGDWQSVIGTIVDFVKYGWPLVLLWAVALGGEQMLQPTPSRPRSPVLSHGLLPALLFLGLGALTVFVSGPRLGLFRQ